MENVQQGRGETRWKQTTVTLGVVILLLIGGIFLFVYSGLYNVAATNHRTRPVAWVLRKTMERSVRAHAKGIQVPPGVDLRDRALAEQAIGHYSTACRTCHGAPGADPEPWIVIYPEPPDLTQTEVVSRWSDAELYWIIKHGIKDTGMLALGPTHKDEDIWAVAAFVRQLPGMAPAEYQAMVQQHEAEKREKGSGMSGDQPSGPRRDTEHKHWKEK